MAARRNCSPCSLLAFSSASLQFSQGNLVVPCLVRSSPLPCSSFVEMNINNRCARPILVHYLDFPGTVSIRESIITRRTTMFPVSPVEGQLAQLSETKFQLVFRLPAFFFLFLSLKIIYYFNFPLFHPLPGTKLKFHERTESYLHSTWHVHCISRKKSGFFFPPFFPLFLVRLT